MSRRIFVRLFVFTASLVALGAILGTMVFPLFRLRPAGSSDYIVMYMNSGDVYFGKPQWSPRFSLAHPWLIQRSTQNSQTRLSIVPLTSSLGEPIDRMYPNVEQSIFWTYLKKDSKTVQMFENRASQGNQAPPAQESPASPPAASPSP